MTCCWFVQCRITMTVWSTHNRGGTQAKLHMRYVHTTNRLSNVSSIESEECVVYSKSAGWCYLNPLLHVWTIKEPHLPYKTGLDVTQSHPLRRTRFGQYQASSAALGWPGDGDAWWSWMWNSFTNECHASLPEKRIGALTNIFTFNYKRCHVMFKTTQCPQSK